MVKYGLQFWSCINRTKIMTRGQAVVSQAWLYSFSVNFGICIHWSYLLLKNLVYTALLSLSFFSDPKPLLIDFIPFYDLAEGHQLQYLLQVFLHLFNM